MQLAVLVPFVLTVLVGAMVPGPATALVLRRGAIHGGRATVGVIAGMEIGIFCWALASAVGLAALVAASEMGYDVLRIVGATVLVLLGIQAWRASRHAHAPGTATLPAAPSFWHGLSTGLVTNLANPKIAVFFFAFYPQFVTAGSSVFATTVLLGAVHVVVDASWYSSVALLVNSARRWFTRSSVRRWLERVTGTVLIALGVRMAILSP